MTYRLDLFVRHQGRGVADASHFDQVRARAALTHLGVRFALSTIEGFCDASSDPLALPRLSIGSDLSFARFRLLVSGALESLRGARS